MDWTEEYRPESLNDVIGNKKQIKRLHDWANNWDEETEPVVIHGSPGIGKTTTAHALASELGWSIMEMNASDKRTGSIIKKIAGESSKTINLTGERRKLLILDEADNLHGHSDRGGKSQLTKTLKQSKQPIILIANDYYELTRTLRNNTIEIKFDEIGEKDIAKGLSRICKKNNIEYEPEALLKISRGANGDMRAAVNDLQKNTVGRSKITKSDVLVTHRNKKEEIFPFMDYLFKKDNPKEIYERYRELDMSPSDLIRWVDENIHREYEDEQEFRDGMHHLSMANIWLSRTMESQEYRYWRYASMELTSGIASARQRKHGGWTRWQYPRYRTKKGPSEELLEKIAEKEGCSVQIARIEVLPFIKSLIPYCKPKELAIEIAAWYDMSASDLSEITGSGKSTNKVQGIIESAEEIQQDFDIPKITHSRFEKIEKANDNKSDIEENKDSSEEEIEMKDESKDEEKGQSELEDFF